MSSHIRSESLHPCHHLSEPLRNMFWCRHCMKIFTDPIDRWRHSKVCREAVQTGEEAVESKQMSQKEGTLFRFGVWEAETVISRPSDTEGKESKQYAIRIADTGKVASHKGEVDPQNFDLQCVICRTPFKSIDEMRNHVKTPCSKVPETETTNRFPSEITNVAELPENLCENAEVIVSCAASAASPDVPPEDLKACSETPVVDDKKEELVLLGNWDEVDGMPLCLSVSENLIFTPSSLPDIPDVPQEPKECKPESSEPIHDIPVKEEVQDVEKVLDLQVPEDEHITPAVPLSFNVRGIVELDGKVPTLEITKFVLPEGEDPATFVHSPESVKTSPGFKEKSQIKRSDSPTKTVKSSPKKSGCMSPRKRRELQGDDSDSVQAKCIKVGSKKSVSPKKKSPAKNANTSPSKKSKNNETTAEEKKGQKVSNKNEVSNKKAITKPSRPKKCPACGREFKSSELLQRHNKVPCRVKLTRNVCAKVLRSKCQSSDKENGRIMLRRNSQGLNPVVPKPVVKRVRPKKPAKKPLPLFFGNPNLPQYKLKFTELSEKEQFMFKLGMVPHVGSHESQTADGHGGFLLDLSDAPADEELEVLTSFNSDNPSANDYLSPPMLEIIPSFSNEDGTDIPDDLGPPELDLINPAKSQRVMDVNSPTFTSQIDHIKTQNKLSKKRGRGGMSRKSLKSPYSILHPIASSAKKKQRPSSAPVLSASRTSQRLKQKAIEKMSKEEKDEAEKSPQNKQKSSDDQDHKIQECLNAEIEPANEDTVSPQSVDVLHKDECKDSKSKTDLSGEAKPYEDKPSDTPVSKESSPGETSPEEVTPSVSTRKNLFEALENSSATDGSLGQGSKTSPVKENRNKFMEKISEAKSRLGKILSPKVSAMCQKPQVAEPVFTEIKQVISKPKTSDTNGSEKTSENQPREFPAQGTEPSTVVNIDKSPCDALKGSRTLARKAPRLTPRKSYTDWEALSKLNNSLSEEELKKPPMKTVTTNTIRLPLLGCRGAPRPFAALLPSKRRALALIKDMAERGTESTANDSTSAAGFAKPLGTGGLLAKSPPSIALSRPVKQSSDATTNTSTHAHIGNSSTVAKVNGPIMQPREDSTLLTANPDISPLFLEKSRLPSSEKVTVQYINQVDLMPSFMDISFRGDEGEITHPSVIDIDSNKNGNEMAPSGLEVQSIDPEFQAIKF